jgi:hypothetical protein
MLDLGRKKEVICQQRYHGSQRNRSIRELQQRRLLPVKASLEEDHPYDQEAEIKPQTNSSHKDSPCSTHCPLLDPSPFFMLLPSCSR